MKKLFLLTISLCVALLVQSQTTVTITAGGLENALSSQTFPITHLVVNGTMDVRDFSIIQDWVKSSLVTLDLSGVTKIEEYTGWGTNDNKTYPANEFPEKALYQVNGALTTVILPANAGITSIGSQAFSDCTKLTSINIPDGLVNIGDFAFYRTGITSITIPEGVTTIGAGVFSWATALTSVTLPGSLTSLGSSVFAYANHLTQVTFPASVNLTSIPNNAFEATLISSITIPETVTTIGNYAFRSCVSLQEIHLPEGLQWFGGTQTFHGCTTLTTINIPEGVQIIDGVLKGTFYQTKITSFKVPANVTQILENTFYNTASLTSFTFADNNSLKVLGDYSLAGTKLTSIIIPEGVTGIGISALGAITTLETLELPASLETIAKQAFDGNTGLKSIKVNSDFPVNLSNSPDVFKNIDKATCILYVPAGSEEAYREADGWKEFQNIRAIGSDAQEQTIANFNDITATVGAVIELNATASSGLPVTYAIADATTATLEGNKLTILKEGETTITASQSGDEDHFLSVEKTVNLIAVSYNWLEEVAIAVEGNTAQVIGTADAVARFTKFYINDTETQLIDGKADLSDKTGEVSLKATTADGAEVIKLMINKQ